MASRACWARGSPDFGVNFPIIGRAQKNRASPTKNRVRGVDSGKFGEPRLLQNRAPRFWSATGIHRFPYDSTFHFRSRLCGRGRSRSFKCAARAAAPKIGLALTKNWGRGWIPGNLARRASAARHHPLTRCLARPLQGAKRPPPRDLRQVYTPKSFQVMSSSAIFTPFW